MKRKKYSFEFKCEVVKQALEEQSLGSVARRHQLNSLTIYRWISEYKQGKYNVVVNSKQSTL
ncbi:transposase [Aneurinibacillus migulanus]|uniref:transposase n=1 Tax=Aneurinibacillus migulanus TaxID=47500 RepID=UPI002E1D5C53|nr:transposase [Aneurinibacillus migulanus]MED4727083.1 transposase [Aneurinibacillus migulanus]